MFDDEDIDTEPEDTEQDTEQETEQDTASGEATAPAENEKPKNTISADLIRGHINTIILRTLAERDKYGYEIIDEIEKRSHGQYELKQPTLYSALKRLENQGYIKAYWKTDETSAGGRRKYFTLTESGKQITEQNRAEWEYSRTVIDSLISDREFDFSKPAPTPVDFKILKQSTSRVPTVKTSENDEENAGKNEEQKTDDNLTVVEYAYCEGLQNSMNIGISEVVFAEDNPEQEGNAETAQTSQEAVQQPAAPVVQETPEQTARAEQPAAAEPIAPVVEDVAAEPAPAAVQEVTTEPAAPVASEAAEPAAPVVEEIIQEPTPAPQPVMEQPQPVYYNEEMAAQQQAYAQPAAPAMGNYPPQAADRAPAESEQYRKLHENYMRLLDENYGKKAEQPAPEYGDNIDTDKLIYNNKPVTERDYKNLINDMYSQTIRRQPAAHFAEPAQEQVQAPQPAPAPVREQRKQAAPQEPIRRPSDETRRAQSDGLKIYTSDREVKPNGKYSKNYNVGETLFKSSAVAFVYLLLIFAVTLIFKNELNVGYAYPFVIFALGCCMVMVCGVMALCGYGKNAVKPISHGYIAISIVLTVIAIFITCVVAILLNVDFSSAVDVMAKMVIPSLCLLTAPLFSAIFYLFTK